MPIYKAMVDLVFKFNSGEHSSARKLLTYLNVLKTVYTYGMLDVGRHATWREFGMRHGNRLNFTWGHTFYILMKWEKQD